MASESTVAGQHAWLEFRPHYRPDIEGLRALAVLIVVGFHAKIPGFTGGFVGVDVFFVLSGYLITWILVNEAELKGSVDLKRFYARRARRLLPAMAVLLAVTLVVTLFLYAPFEQKELARTWASTALYVSNLDFASSALDYHGAAAETNPLLHTWSLSVEEQFYLVWPWLLLLGLRMLRWQKHRPLPRMQTLLWVLGATTLLSFFLSLYLTHTEGGWAFYLSPTRAWEFALGGIAVLIPVNRRSPQQSPATRSGLRTTLLSWMALGGLVAATLLYDEETPFPGVAAVLPVLATVVLLRTGTRSDEAPTWSLRRLLALRPLQFIGKLSYSWYLWHWPALVFLDAVMEIPSMGARLIAAIVSLGLAYLSYTYVENPLRHSPFLAKRPARSFAMAFGISGVAVLLVLLWFKSSTHWNTTGYQGFIAQTVDERPLIFKDGCARLGRGEVIECVYGDSLATQTAVLVGDSHAAQFFPALHQAVDDAGWRLVVLVLPGCPMVELPSLYSTYLRRMYPECVQWRQDAQEDIGQHQPDLTFVASGSGYSATGVTPETWETGTRAILTNLLPKSDRVVLILDPLLPNHDAAACLARADWRIGEFFDPDCHIQARPGSVALVDAQVRAAQAVPATEMLDMRNAVCPQDGCPPTIDGFIRYRDRGHVSVAFARTFSDTFRAYLSPVESDPYH